MSLSVYTQYNSLFNPLDNFTPFSTMSVFKFSQYIIFSGVELHAILKILTYAWKSIKARYSIDKMTL